MTHPRPRPDQSNSLCLGIEAGATRTVAILADIQGHALARISTGPANLRLLDDRALHRHFLAIARRIPQPGSLAVGMAGARTEADRDRIRKAAAKAWPGIPCLATNDLETALAAAAAPSAVGAAAKKPANAPARVLVLSGTGSCCFGRFNQRSAKVGGWGHILGDKGSGYEIGLRSLKAVVYYFDRDGNWPKLGRRLLRATELNEPNDLIGWALQASKSDIAVLAVETFTAWAQRDPIANDIVTSAAHSLARDAISCARRLVRSGAAVQFILAGSVLLQQPRFARMVQREIRGGWPDAVVAPLARESAWGAVELARAYAGTNAAETKLASRHATPQADARTSELPIADQRALAQSPTEQRNPRSMNLDRLPLRQAIGLMLSEDSRLPAAVLAQRTQIERAIRLITRSLKQGGRLIYVGAGTSGRLGVLDASECPPTFQTDPDLVQGIIAGGQRALWEAVEGAEDDPQAGARAIEFRGVGRRDTVVGITASGRTPFVRGALREAKSRRAATVLLCFNPGMRWAKEERPDLILAPDVGPEILTGSTRLKAGTATKLILNIFTTLAMVQLGKVLENLMIDVKASNEKLRDRAIRMVTELTGCDSGKAREALVKARWQIRSACARLSKRGARASSSF